MDCFAGSQIVMNRNAIAGLAEDSQAFLKALIKKFDLQRETRGFIILFSIL